jgi:predicted transcriptional regulator
MISLKAHEVMSVDIEAATENASLVEVATRIALGVFNGMPVIDGNGHPVGQITTIDILKAIRNGRDINNTIVKEAMSPNPFIVEENTSVDEIIKLMDK